MAGFRFAEPNHAFVDSNGEVLVSGTVTFYATGTTTLQATYSDDALTTPNANPLTLNASGRLPVDVFLDPTLGYRRILKNAAGSTIDDRDPLGGSDVTNAVAAHNVDTSAHYAATESQRGFVELLSDAEAQAGVDTSRAMTAANLQAVTATTTRKGVVELATDAEAIAGTDTARAVTPAALAAAISGASGSDVLTGDFESAATTTSFLFKIPGATVLTVQGGITAEYTGESASDSVTFTENFAAVPHVYVSGYQATAQSPIVNVASVSVSGFTFNISDRDTSGADFVTKVAWWAVGAEV